MSELTYILTFDGAVLSAGLSTHDAGLDAAQQRNAWNQQVLPARHMRGRIREALEEMVASYLLRRPEQADAEALAFKAVATIFGDGASTSSGGGGSGATDRASRSVVAFDDAVLIPQSHGDHLPSTRSRAGSFERLRDEHLRGVDAPDVAELEVRHRIVVDRHTGAVLPSHLGMAEAGRAGKLQRFRGKVEVPEQGAFGLSCGELISLLGWAFRWLGCVGRTTQSGWGRIQERKLAPEPDLELTCLLEGLLQAAATTSTLLPTKTVFAEKVRPKARVDFAVVLDAPLVIGERGAMANVVEGRTDVPGSVLRRAMADVLLEAAGRRRGGWVDSALSAEITDPSDKELAKHFDEIEASFALWVPPDEPRVIPQPHTVTKRGVDYLRVHIDASHGDKAALAELVKAQGDKLFKQSPRVPPRELRTHVAKSRSSGGGSEGNLFSVRAISPRCPVSSKTNAVQHTRLDGWVRCPERLVDNVRSVLGRVRRLGKSSSQGYGAVRMYAVDPAEDRWQDRLCKWNQGLSGPGVEVPILLVTEALLLDPRELTLGADLTPVYRRFFAKELRKRHKDKGLDKELEGLSVRFCSVRHRLYGGATARGIGATPPAVLTQAGSVWVLHLTLDVDGTPINLKRAISLLAPLVAWGLENREALGEVEQRWQRMAPTTAANGYGEIRIAHGLGPKDTTHEH